MTVLDEHANMPARLRAAADEVEETRTRYQLATQTRNDLVVTAVDVVGMSYGQIAHAAGISKPHVIRILSRSDDLPDAG